SDDADLPHWSEVEELADQEAERLRTWLKSASIGSLIALGGARAECCFVAITECDTSCWDAFQMEMDRMHGSFAVPNPISISAHGKLAKRVSFDWSGYAISRPEVVAQIGLMAALKTRAYYFPLALSSS